jgi:hypothetical protein
MPTFNDIKNRIAAIQAEKLALITDHQTTINLRNGWRYIVQVVETQRGIDIETNLLNASARRIADVNLIPKGTLREIADILDKVDAFKAGDTEWPF